MQGSQAATKYRLLHQDTARLTEGRQLGQGVQTLETSDHSCAWGPGPSRGQAEEEANSSQGSVPLPSSTGHPSHQAHFGLLELEPARSPLTFKFVIVVLLFSI